MDLDDAAGELALLLGSPIVVLDQDMNLVTHTAQGDDVDRAQLSIILSRRGTDGAINAIRGQRVDRAAGFVRLPPEGDVPAHIAMPLRHAGEVVGFATFPDSGESGLFRQTMNALLLAASDDLGEALAVRRDEKRAAAQRERQLLGMLLSRVHEDRRSAAEVILAERLLAPNGAYTAAVFRTIPGDAAPSDSAELAETVRSAARLTPLAALSGVIGDVGVVVFSRDLDPHLLQRLAKAPQLAGVVIGLGDPREALADVSHSYREGEIAREAAQRDPRNYSGFARWRDLGRDGLLVQLPLGELSLSHLPASVRRLLASPDARHLVETLEDYLDNRGNAMETAKRLNVHRSTLYHRLDEIREVSGADLSSSSALRELDLGLRVARLAGLSERQHR